MPVRGVDEFLAEELDALARLASVLTGQRELAEELLSDVLIVVLRKWRSISEAVSPSAYVRRLMVNTFLSERRAHASRRRRERTFNDQRTGISEDHARSVVDRDEAHQLLARLTSQQRAALVMRFYLDMSDADIAPVLNCQPSTVRSHVSHGLATLRNADLVPESQKEQNQRDK